MDAFISTILPWPTNFAPQDWQYCQGQQLAINQYQAIYSLIGILYGGDAVKNFNLPNLSGRTMYGSGINAQHQQYVQGTTAGQTTATVSTQSGAGGLVLANMPQHTHGATFAPTTGSQSVVIPGTAASGSITASATTDIVPGSAGVDPLPKISNYYLTGVTTSANGPVTQTVPGTDKSTLLGTTVSVDASNFKPAIPQQTVSINTVTGGSVTVAPAGSATPTPFSVSISRGTVATEPPYLVLNFIFCMVGQYPMRP